MRERKEPKTKPNEIGSTPCEWIVLRGRALVLAFGEWNIRGAGRRILPITNAGGVSGDFWAHAYAPEDAEQIKAWAAKWLAKHGRDKLASDEDGLAYGDEG